MKKLMAAIALFSVTIFLFTGDVPAFTQEAHFQVSVDIMPGSLDNPINLKSNGVSPVALFGTANFDVKDVVISTVALHPHDRMEGAIPPVKYAFTDINKDGILDIILHFSTQTLVPLLQTSDTALCLHGDNPNVVPGHFCGMDSVIIKFK